MTHGDFPLSTSDIKAIRARADVAAKAAEYQAVESERTAAVMQCQMRKAAELLPRVKAAKMAYMMAERRARNV